jgi:DNA-3-methyladenine glycosylase I
MHNEKSRCNWGSSNELLIQYHDEEWGVPVHDDNKLFEFLSLDCFQAGLSWLTILKKRESFRKAFDNFDIDKVAAYDDAKVEELSINEGIIRNAQKIKAVINNAQQILKIRKEFGSFDQYIWQFTEGKTISPKCEKMTDIAVQSDESDAMSRDMRKRGFQFIGSTICYAFMQSCGMINDHITNCYRHKEIEAMVVG